MLFHPTIQSRPKRHGAVTAWLLVGIVVIVGIVAIGMDGGRMLDKRRHAQATADAVALAGAVSVFNIDIGQNGVATGDKRGAAQSAGVVQAAANGFNNDGITSIVTVNYPPSSGAFAGKSDFVEAIVQYNLPKSFGGIFTNGSLPVSARAVAVGRPVQVGIVLFQQSGANAFLGSGNGSLTVASGSVFVNSNDATAFALINGVSVTALDYNVTGNYTSAGATKLQGQIYTGTQRMPDPLLSLPVPDVSSLSTQSMSPLSINSGAAVLWPGIYRGGINIGQTATVFMMPGVYVMQGGGFQVRDQADVVGITPLIYNTSGTAPAGPININTNGSFAVSANATGTYRGVSIYQDRGLTQPLNISGNGSTYIGGAVYAAAAPVTLAVNDKKSSATLGTAYICNTMQAKGDGNITIDTTINPLIVPQITLVE